MQNGPACARQDKLLYSQIKQDNNYGHANGPHARAQVVIVGAGLAGLAAAQRLHESGVDDVLLLDAQDRIGGRVHTIEHEDYLLELGAQWLHGADQNPLYQWLTSLEMLDDFEDASLGFQGIFCTPGKRQIDAGLVERVLSIVRQCKLELSKNPNYIDIIADGSENKASKNDQLNAGQVFRLKLQEHLSRDEELSKNKEQVMAIFEWFLRYETIENCCDSMEEVSIASYTDWTDWGDGTLLNFKHGYRSLLQWFCAGFPAKQWLHLNRQVLQIELLTLGCDTSTKSSEASIYKWHSSEDNSWHAGPILVRYKHTNSRAVQYIECNHVIVTCSLGFMKQNHETLFKPKLAKWRRELIGSIGFGTVNKIVLQFETPFWNDGIKLVWPGADRAMQQFDSVALPEWTRDIIAFDSVRRQPNILIGWIGGQGAKQIEKLADDEVGRICLSLLDKFLPGYHRRPSKLVACFCSRWHSNAFTCGSYSFQSMESFNLNVERLHEPIYTNKFGQVNNEQLCGISDQSSQARSPRILFAGEATAGKLYSTTHGAIITGWREADRLKSYLSNTRQQNFVQSNSDIVVRPRIGPQQVELTNFV